MPQVFVYGTLRTPTKSTQPADTHYHRRIADEIVSRSGATLSNAVLYDLGAFPGIGLGEGGVRGEVFEVSESALAAADVIEGHPDFYQRRLERPTLGDGTEVDAWAYWAPASLLDGRPAIPSGDWFDRTPTSEPPPALLLPDDPELERLMCRLGDDEYSWFTSVRPDGRPHSVPMWHVAVGNRIYFATSLDAVKRSNIAINPHVTIALVDPRDVVRVEGWAIDAPTARSLVAPHLMAKYNWNLDQDDPTHVIIEVTPRVVVSWSGHSSHNRWIL